MCSRRCFVIVCLVWVVNVDISICCGYCVDSLKELKDCIVGVKFGFWCNEIICFFIWGYCLNESFENSGCYVNKVYKVEMV